MVQQLCTWWGNSAVRPQLVVNDWQASKPGFRGNVLHIRLQAISAHLPLRFLASLRHVPVTLWRTHRALRSQNVVAVNFHYTDTAPFGIALLKRIGVFRGRLVISFHGTDVREVNGLLERLLLRFCYGAADALVACSTSLADRMAATLPVQRAQVVVVRNGVDTEVFRPDAALTSQLAGRLPLRYLVSVGAFIARKAHRHLLEAFRTVAWAHPDLHLVIAGAPGPLLEDTRGQAEALQLAERVHMLVGLKQGEVAGVLSRAELCVQPALAESMPLSVLEAGAAGVPLAVSRIPGHDELIQEGQTGYLFEPACSESCAQVILQALNHAAQAKSQAHRFRELVRSELTWATCVAAYHRLYGIDSDERAGGMYSLNA